MAVPPDERDSAPPLHSALPLADDVPESTEPVEISGASPAPSVPEAETGELPAPQPSSHASLEGLSREGLPQAAREAELEGTPRGSQGSRPGEGPRGARDSSPGSGGRSPRDSSPGGAPRGLRDSSPGGASRGLRDSRPSGQAPGPQDVSPEGAVRGAQDSHPSRPRDSVSGGRSRSARDSSPGGSRGPPAVGDRLTGEPEVERREYVRGDRVDRYIVLNSVGQGGMGVVYAAYDPELDRKVALKLLRLRGREPDPTAGRARLQREAQAMARISHPNVCAVYDVGTLGDQVFMTMELIEGQTLHRWLKETPRTWREILRVFIEAGQGVAAAHEAGLVHRDFKPTNVLISKAGRVYVTDFGLARLVVPSGEEPSVSLEQLRQGGTTTLSETVTHEGMVMGTPQYMPPEQYLGNVPDSRSDQFSFCAALYWALFERRPFEPKRVASAAAELSQALTASNLTPKARPNAPLKDVIQEPPTGTRVPAWVRRALLRGLALHPNDRFPSMAQLLEALSQEQRRVRQRWLLLGTGLAGLVVALGGVLWRLQSQVCVGAEMLTAQVWNAEVKAKIDESFAATHQPFASEMAGAAGRVVDAYAKDWARQHTEACEATRIHKTQTEALYSSRVVCLERRRKDIQALARVLSQADAQLVSKAVQVALELPALQECEDIDSLTNQTAMPSDPEQRKQIVQLGAELSELKFLAIAGHYKDVLTRAGKLEPRVAATGYLPLLAELRMRKGKVQIEVGEAEEGARQIENAVSDAEAARADRLKVEILNQLIFARAILGQNEQAESWARLADATLKRIGGDPILESQRAGNLGIAMMQRGKYAEAERYFEQTRVLQEKLAPDDPRRVLTFYILGVAATQAGDYASATVRLTEALRQMETVLGKRHPQVAQCHAMLAWAYREGGDPLRALEHAQKSLALRTLLFGEEHPQVADALDTLGMCQLKLSRNEEARKTFEKSLAMKDKLLQPEDNFRAYSYDGLGQALLAGGRPAEAIEPLEKALSFEGMGPESLADSGFSLAKALWISDVDRPRARVEAKKARDHYAEVGKKDRVQEVEKWLNGRQQDDPVPPAPRGKGPGHAANLRK